MNHDIRDLYQEIILDHNKRPRNCRVMQPADRLADGHNPLCGDKVTVYVRLQNGRVEDVSFQGSGCAISTASASLMTEAVRGKTLAEAKTLFAEFHRLVTGGVTPEQAFDQLGKLAVFSGVSEFPTRVKCATLAWHTLQAALDAPGEKAPVVSTE